MAGNDGRLDMAYEEYLAMWTEKFEDAPEGEYGYWYHGEYRPCRVRRLTEEEFRSAVIALWYWDNEYKRFKAAGNDLAMEACLLQAFPYELQLLI